MNTLRVISVLSLVVLWGCNKEEKYSKILLKDAIWKITELTIDGGEVDFLGEWEIDRDGPSIYDALPSATWVYKRNPYPDPEKVLSWSSVYEKNKAITLYNDAKLKERKEKFNWQFQKKGNAFQIASYPLCPNCDPTKVNHVNPSNLHFFLRDISGIYKVDKVDKVSKKKDKIEFSCTETIAYRGKKVKITIEK